MQNTDIFHYKEQPVKQDSMTTNQAVVLHKLSVPKLFKAKR
jgi:hypothetical protein